MSRELNLRFPDKDHVIVLLDRDDSGELRFTNPLNAKDRQDIQWYLEVYGAHSLGDPDDGEAARIAAQLPAWGKGLFEAVLGDRAAQRLFNRFQESEDEARRAAAVGDWPSTPGPTTLFRPRGRKIASCGGSGYYVVVATERKNPPSQPPW